MRSEPAPDPFATIDRLVCGVGLAPEAVISRAEALQAAARRFTAESPLSHFIATALLSMTGQDVALFTGFVVPDVLPYGETDGPLGTVALARALDGVGVHTTVHTDPEVLDHTRWLAAEIGAAISIVPLEPNTADVLVDRIDAAIAIEKPGANAAGYLHTWGGQRIERGSSAVDVLFARLRELGKLTAAIGDRGNEVGFGAIHHEVLCLVPEARRCACGCEGGIASTTPVDLLFPAAVSNWGAYGLCAAIALLAGDSDLALHPEEEERLLNVAAVRGCRDGLLRAPAFGVDGISGPTSIRVVDALFRLVDSSQAASQK